MPLVAWHRRGEKSRFLDSRVWGVLLPLLLSVYPAGHGVCPNLSLDHPEATRGTKFPDNPAKQRGKLCEGADLARHTRLRLFFSSGPGSFSSGIVAQRPLFIRGCRTFRQRFFRAASEQRHARCLAARAISFGESAWHLCFQFRRHSRFL